MTAKELTYEPIHTVPATEAPRPRHDQPTPRVDRQHHCRCERIFPDGAVVNGAHFFDDKIGSYTMARQLYCDHCHHVIFWFETCSPEGVPRCVKTTQPHVCKGETFLNNFLDTYPQARGVADV